MKLIMTAQKTLFTLCSLLIVLGAVCRADTFTLPPPGDAAEALRLDFYQYDNKLPLNAALTSAAALLPTGRGRTWFTTARTTRK